MHGPVPYPICCVFVIAQLRLQIAAVFKVLGFDASMHTGLDGAHTIGGVINDTVVKCLQALRFNTTVEGYEASVTKRFKKGEKPWKLTEKDKAAFEEALWDIVASTCSRMTGNRFGRLFQACKKNKLHASFVLASPYGEDKAIKSCCVCSSCSMPHSSSDRMPQGCCVYQSTS